MGELRVPKSLPRAKKSLGQNFLSDGNMLEKIVRAAHVEKGDTVVEVGPGPGGLTTKLVATGYPLILIEKDKDMEPYLAEHAQNNHVELVFEDVLKWDRSSLPMPYKVIANIPYYITTEILKTFLSDNSKLPTTMVIMVQKEFAQKATAKPPHASSLSMWLAQYGTVTMEAKVPRHLFTPAPKVDSAILRIEVEHQDVSKALLSFIHQGFSQKRKKVKSALKSLLKDKDVSSVSNLLEQRAEQLSSEDWKSLFAVYQG